MNYLTVVLQTSILTTRQFFKDQSIHYMMKRERKNARELTHKTPTYPPNSYGRPSPYGNPTSTNEDESQGRPTPYANNYPAPKPHPMKKIIIINPNQLMITNPNPPENQKQPQHQLQVQPQNQPQLQLILNHLRLIHQLKVQAQVPAIVQAAIHQQDQV